MFPFATVPIVTELLKVVSFSALLRISYESYKVGFPLSFAVHCKTTLSENSPFVAVKEVITLDKTGVKLTVVDKFEAVKPHVLDAET